MLELDAPQADRARKLHQESLVVDTLNGGPVLRTPELLVRMQRTSTRDGRLPRSWRAMPKPSTS